MSIGLMALLDDVAGLAKVAAASLDDVAGQVAQAGVKAAGVVIDDAAVTPRYVTGFAAARELPIVGKIALGSLRNKLLILLPAALALSLLAPWAILPLLMLGGLYLCFEGTEKVAEAIMPQASHAAELDLGATATADICPETLEARKVSSAIKTDFILSAEIMAITLGAVPEASLWSQAITLAIVGIGITVVVYGGVALIVKADDAGLALAGMGQGKAWGRPVRALGRGLVLGMPWLLGLLSVVGTAAMIWVGGGIIVHGLEEFGVPEIAHLIEGAARAAATSLPPVAGLAGWIVAAAGSGLIGLLIGAVLVAIATAAARWRGIAKSGE